jgi:hypothetical protein
VRTVARCKESSRRRHPASGTFFLHAYAGGGRRNWANLVFDAKVDGGTQTTPPHAARRTRIAGASV